MYIEKQAKIHTEKNMNRIHIKRKKYYIAFIKQSIGWAAQNYVVK